MTSKIKLFFEESRREFRHINWPSMAETRHLTFIVIGMSLAFAAFLGLLDFAFERILSIIL